MTIPNRYSPSNNQPTPPNCPHCGQPLAELKCYSWTMQVAAGLMQIFATHCPHDECRRVLGSPVVAMIPHAQEEQGAGLIQA